MRVTAQAEERFAAIALWDVRRAYRSGDETITALAGFDENRQCSQANRDPRIRVWTRLHS